MKQMLKETLIIFLITLLAGAALGSIYMITKEPIAVQEQLAKDRAYQAVFTNANTFIEESNFDSEHAQVVLKNIDPEHDYSGTDVDMFASAYKDEELLGFVITVTNHNGYGGDITFTMGIRLDGTMNGISITSISETAGLGMKASDVLAPQFVDKSAESRFNVTKTGAVYPTDIDAISSATITSKAVVDGVNTGCAYYQYRLSQYQTDENSIPNLSNQGIIEGGGADA